MLEEWPKLEMSASPLVGWDQEEGPGSTSRSKWEPPCALSMEGSGIPWQGATRQWEPGFHVLKGTPPRWDTALGLPEQDSDCAGYHDRVRHRAMTQCREFHHRIMGIIPRPHHAEEAPGTLGEVWKARAPGSSPSSSGCVFRQGLSSGQIQSHQNEPTLATPMVGGGSSHSLERRLVNKIFRKEPQDMAQHPPHGPICPPPTFTQAWPHHHPTPSHSNARRWP